MPNAGEWVGVIVWSESVRKLTEVINVVCKHNATTHKLDLSVHVKKAVIKDTIAHCMAPWSHSSVSL